MSEIKPPVELELAWDGDLRFKGWSGDLELTLDSASQAGLGPMQLLAFGLAGCMAVDVVHIAQWEMFAGTATALRRGRPAFRGHGRGGTPARGAGDRSFTREVLLGLALAAPGHRVHLHVRRCGVSRAFMNDAG